MNLVKNATGSVLESALEGKSMDEVDIENPPQRNIVTIDTVTDTSSLTCCDWVHRIQLIASCIFAVVGVTGVIAASAGVDPTVAVGVAAGIILTYESAKAIAYNAMYTKLGGFTRQTDRLEAEVDDLKNQVDDLTEQNTNYATLNKAHKKKLKELNTLINTFSSTFSEQNAALENNIEEIGEISTKLSLTFDRTKQNLEKQSQRIKELKDHVALFAEKIDNFEAIEEKQKELLRDQMALHQSREDLHRQEENLHRQQSVLLKRLNEEAEKQQELTSQLDELTKRFDKAKPVALKLIARVIQLNAEKSKTSSLITRIQQVTENTIQSFFQSNPSTGCDSNALIKSVLGRQKVAVADSKVTSNSFLKRTRNKRNSQ